jgi:hypothetical protein
MIEVEGYVSHWLSELLDEASDCSSPISVHTGPRGVFAGIRPKVFASQNSGANGAKRDCH